MTSTINRDALAAFVDLLDNKPQSLISFEHAVQLMTQIGFSCRLACQIENWNQSVRFFGPPSALAPVEAEVETPLGSQHITLEQYMSLPQAVHSALEEMHQILHQLRELEAKGLETAQCQELMKRAQVMERDIVDGPGRFQRSGSFEWPMDRFQLLIEYGDRAEVVTICGPFMAVLSRASLADETEPGVGVSDIAKATVKLLMDRTINGAAQLAPVSEHARKEDN